ncbi:MAG: arginine--tRNA ligase [Candidatus Omnitrophica bacterium]|nr:arginine--tRNA ligase [Candidatus Omnitrophota bacterium]MBU4467447.1 arginine--tRNA ligase [Candidatus Omnitrophota bacterium]MCG2708542.1 arginine--tRNA ligase [Candidatus Omnitrophota bacterium]
MKNDIQQELIALVNASLAHSGLAADYKDDIFLELPTDKRFGDFTTNIALKLSKELKQPPRVIASQLVESIRKEIKNNADLKDLITQVKVEGAGFVNFYLQENYFYEKLRRIITQGKEALKIDLGKGKKVLIEFVSANPTGSLSVAHARQAAVGDCLANVLSFIGFKVSREYYLNDEGNQINILGKSVQLRLKELKGESIEFPQNYYQGDYIKDIAQEADNKKIKEEDLGDFAAGHILKIIKQELDDFGVKFDCWYSQKELAKSGKVEQGFEQLKQKGFLYEQDGALWFKSTAFGDDKDRVIIKSDGSQTYLAPDIAYHEDKFKRGYSWLINLWGPDHHGYINRIKASIEAFGHKKDDLSIVIVQLATIFRNGQEIQMSTRRGQYITLREVLDEVGADAARFFFLMRRTSSHLDFDLEVAKKQSSENPVYYVQYAHARICSILRSSSVTIKDDLDLSVLGEKEELSLIKKLLEFEATLNICLVTSDPYMLTVYLQELSESFHKFYDLHRVLGQDDALTGARLALIKGVKIVLASGLGLLGITQPEKM